MTYSCVPLSLTRKALINRSKGHHAFNMVTRFSEYISGEGSSSRLREVTNKRLSAESRRSARCTTNSRRMFLDRTYCYCPNRDQTVGSCGMCAGNLHVAARPASHPTLNGAIRPSHSSSRILPELLKSNTRRLRARSTSLSTTSPSQGSQNGSRAILCVRNGDQGSTPCIHYLRKTTQTRLVMFVA